MLMLVHAGRFCEICDADFLVVFRDSEHPRDADNIKKGCIIMLKRFLSFLLLASMLVSIAACGGTTPADTGNSTDTGDTTPADTTEAVQAPDIERTDYNGDTFQILQAKNSSTGSLYGATEYTGEVMNDASYKRDLWVEDYLGIDIVYKMHDAMSIADPIQAAVMADENSYQLGITHPMHGAAPMVAGGLLMDWGDIDYVDFSQPYWHSDCNEELAVNGKQYLASSEIILSNVFCVYFNKDLIDKYKLENPYDLMRSGEWTFDKMIEMGTGVSEDLNGDTKMDVNDQYGFTTVIDYPLCQTMYASGLRLCEPETFELTINNDRMIELIDTMDVLLNRSGITYTWSYEGANEDRMYVADGKALFEFEKSDRLLQARYRNSNVSLGLVPYPKLDAEQDEYYTTDYSGMLCIPKAAGDLEMIGKAVELLSYYSGSTTTPAYYDKMLGDKLARDDDMREMLSYLFDHMVFDGGQRYFGIKQGTQSSKGMQHLYYTIMYMVAADKSTDFGSYYAENVGGAEAVIEEFLAAVDALD